MKEEGYETSSDVVPTSKLLRKISSSLGTCTICNGVLIFDDMSLQGAKELILGDFVKVAVAAH